MATTVHIPERLLAVAHRRARALGISRNRLIVRALERELAEPSSWSPGFLDSLRGVDPAEVAVVDDMLKHIHQRRRSKKPPVL
jgi:hypothetical protein